MIMIITHTWTIKVTHTADSEHTGTEAPRQLPRSERQIQKAQECLVAKLALWSFDRRKAFREVVRLMKGVGKEQKRSKVRWG